MFIHDRLGGGGIVEQNFGHRPLAIAGRHAGIVAHHFARIGEHVAAPIQHVEWHAAHREHDRAKGFERAEFDGQFGRPQGFLIVARLEQCEGQCGVGNRQVWIELDGPAGEHSTLVAITDHQP